MASWGHAVRPISDEDRRYIFADSWPGAKPRYVSDEDWPAMEAERLALWRRCSKRCPNDVAFTVTYHYVTGRAGRTSWAEKHVCREHAEKFAKRNGCAMPEGIHGES